MNIKNIETPALILDAKTFKNNINEMDKILKDSPLSLRPHYKSHKCAAIAHLQIQNGAKGMTCAKLSEAIDLADSGIEDILIANQITDDKKIRRLADLALDCRLTVCVDDLKNAKKLEIAAKNSGSIVHCLIEYEIGMQRCGLTDENKIYELAKFITESSNLEFDGLQAYAGHVSHMESEEERIKYTTENEEKIKKLVAFLKEKKIETKIISGGSTGTSTIKSKTGLYNELQAGSYIFMDSTYKNLDLPFKNSLFILTTVVSKNENITVVDAGVKTCGVDQGMPIVLDNYAEKVVASEEHFQLHNLKKSVNIGDKILLIPAHCCSTVNLHDKIYVVDNNKVVDRILVTARMSGK